MKIVLILLITVFASVILCDISEKHQKAWEKFKIKNKRVFKNATKEAIRMKKFSDTLTKIEAHNAQPNAHVISVNKFADISRAEFIKGHTGYVASDDPEPDDSEPDIDESSRAKRAVKRTRTTRTTTTTTTTPSPPQVFIPDSFDWRSVGAISPTEDQGYCSSCWAFAAIGALQAQIFIKKNKTVSLSQQNLVDCTTDAKGCAGGTIKKGYNYIKANNGVDSDESYPYEALDGKCRYNASNSAGTCKGFIQSTPYSESELKKSVYLNGPHSIAIDASHESLQYYESGIYFEPLCSNTSLNHAVLLIGFGTLEGKNGTQNQDYWIIQNSWGADWGMNGFFYLARNKNNHCGPTNFATCPIV